VDEGSAADKAGLRRADRLLEVNGRSVDDNIDFLYYAGHAVRSLTYERVGKRHFIRFKNSLNPHSLGMILEDFPPRSCNNQCIFCFVHQLPPGLRHSLYFKDEDFRLSFLYGNYITATNLSEKDMDRIIRQRLSPLYLSVHATHPDLRRIILCNPRAPDIMPLLKRLKRHGIGFHVQVVLMPGWNDGENFEETIQDLVTLYPSLLSIAVVPVGLTSHRKNLPHIRPVTPSYACHFIPHVRKIQCALRERFGADFLFLSDEFYLLAGSQPPSYRGYDDIPQHENGVGMVASFYRGFERAVRRMPSRFSPPRKIALITAALGKKVLEKLIHRLQHIRGLKIKILVVRNRLFGPRITVSGLMAGRDVLDRILQNPDFDLYLLPENCLNPDNVFLDDVSLEALQKKTGKCIKIAPPSAKDIISMILLKKEEICSGSHI